MKSKKTYFTTGEFAKIFDVKKQTLFQLQRYCYYIICTLLQVTISFLIAYRI